MTALARLSLLKSTAFLALTSTKFDDVLKPLLGAASFTAARFCNRWDEKESRSSFDLNNYEDEQYTGDGTTVLYLKNYPAVKIIEVKLWDGTDSFDVETDTLYELVDNRYIQYPALGKEANATYPGWLTWPKNGIKITYTAGYSSIGWDIKAVTDAFGVPPDLEYAVATIAQLTWLAGKEGGGRRGITNINVGAQGLTKEVFQSGALPKDIEGILNKYVRLVI